MINNVFYYLYILLQLDDELERRKDLGFTFQQLLRKELDVFNEDEQERQEHQVCFSSSLSEAMRILNETTESNMDLSQLERQR